MQMNSLVPRLNQAEAEKMFREGWREMRWGRLRLVFDFYLPYHFFEIQIKNGKSFTTACFALDAVRGTLDPYQFEYPFSQALESRETKRCCLPALSSEDAFRLLEEKLRRGIFRRGFFKVRHLQITGKAEEINYLPYQVGVYQRRDQVKLEIIDALRGQREGTKVKELIASWLMPDSLQ